MILDLNISPDLQKAQVYFDKLKADNAKIELKKIPAKRTIKQNSYVHKLFTLWASEYGNTVLDAKNAIKRVLGYTHSNPIDGVIEVDETSKMDTKELTIFIDKFRTWSAHGGYYLPSSDEMGDNWDYFAREIERAEVMQNRYG